MHSHILDCSLSSSGTHSPQQNNHCACPSSARRFSALLPPLCMRHCRTFMVRFCTKRTWCAPIDASLRHLNARPGSATSALRGSRGARAAAQNVRSLPPMSRLRLMLPCLEVVQGGRGRLGHRSPFSTCQCARSGGASTGVDPQKERRASAANWFWQAMISAARPAAGHRNDAGVVERACKIFEEIEVTIALAMALWSIATGPRATRAGSSRTGPGSLRAL